MISQSEEQTYAAAKKLAAGLKIPAHILLYGDLGAGKTVFAKGLADGFGVTDVDEVSSPTFTLINQYSGRVRIYHIDLYRIETGSLDGLGLEEIFDDDDRISGISHVIEHMFFKGTAKRRVGDIARETQGLGGYLNASTYYDRTVYHTEVPAENMKKALEIQADALWNSTFDAAELKKEIEVVLQENNRKLDNPPAVASEKLYAIAFQTH